MDACRVAGGAATGRDLRHVDDRFDPGFFGGLGERGGRLEQSGADRVHEVGGARALGGCADGVDVVQVADDHFGTAVTQRCGAVVKAVYQRAYGVTAFEQQFRGVATGFAGGSGDEQRALVSGHRGFLSSLSFAQASSI
jgi:hypothetical protein